MRKKAAVLLSAVIMLTGCIGEPGNTGEDTPFIVQEPEHIALENVSSDCGINCFTIISDNGVAMVEFPFLEGEGAYRFSVYENGELKKRADLPENSGYTSMIFDPERRRYYAYDSFGGALYSLDGDFGSPAELLRADTLGIGSMDFSIRDMEIVDGKLYVLHTSKNPYVGDSERGENGYADFGEQVRVIDPDSGSSDLLDIPNPICGFSDGERLFFYTCENGHYELREYDPAEKTLTSLCDMDDAGYAAAFVICGSKFIYSRGSSNDLFLKNLDTGLITTYADGSYMMCGLDMRLYKGNIIFLDRVSMEIHKIFMGDIGEPDSGMMKFSGTELVISGDRQNNKINLSELRNATGISASIYEFPILEDEMLLKIMAGDSDIDVYTLHSSRSVGRSVRRDGIYVPLDDCAEVNTYLSECHDYISEYARAENGEIWALPVVSSIDAIFYVPENIEKLGFSYENNFKMYSDYIDTMLSMNTQDEFSHFGNPVSDYTMENKYCLNYSGEGYNTDIFKKYFSLTWDGWERADSENHHCPYYGETYWNLESSNFDTETIAFKQSSVEWQITGYDPFNPMNRGVDPFYRWRAFPMPELSSEGEKEAAYLSYLVINPYSRNIEAAKHYLDTIASDHLRYINGFSPVFKDIEKYSGKYDINEPLFRDVYEISCDAGVSEPVIKTDYCEYIDSYQQGKMTLDEVAEYLDRQTEMALNE